LEILNYFGHLIYLRVLERLLYFVDGLMGYGADGIACFATSFSYLLKALDLLYAVWQFIMVNLHVGGIIWCGGAIGWIEIVLDVSDRE
jgi:hypothetical protein